jgi:hypothetical protein
MASLSGYAVVSCHAERVNDDRVWSAFERLLVRRPGGFVITPLLRPPDRKAGEDEEVWLRRARRAAELAPLGHHTHWGGMTQARPVDDLDPAQRVRAETGWLRDHGLSPRFFCGGGWYLDVPLAETLAELGYVDCTATTFRQAYLDDTAPRLQLDGPSRVQLPSGATLLELPATHSVGMLARGILRLDGFVHVHFHDWELVDRKRSIALHALLRALRLRRAPIALDELARRAAEAARVTIGM